MARLLDAAPVAEFLAAVDRGQELAVFGGGMAVFGRSDRLGGLGGVAPAPPDSGKTSGKLRRPERYNRKVQRVFYASALFR